MNALQSYAINTFLTQLKDIIAYASPSELNIIYTISPVIWRTKICSLQGFELADQSVVTTTKRDSQTSTSHTPLWSENTLPKSFEELDLCICAAIEQVSLLQWFWYYFGYEDEVLHLIRQLQEAQRASPQLFDIVPGSIDSRLCGFTAWCLKGGESFDEIARPWIEGRYFHVALVPGDFSKTVQRLCQLNKLYIQRKGCKVDAVDFNVFEQLAIPDILAEGLTVIVREHMMKLTLEDILSGRSYEEKCLMARYRTLHNSLLDAAVLLGDAIGKSLSRLAQVSNVHTYCPFIPAHY